MQLTLTVNYRMSNVSSLALYSAVCANLFLEYLVGGKLVSSTADGRSSSPKKLFVLRINWAWKSSNGRGTIYVG